MAIAAVPALMSTLLRFRAGLAVPLSFLLLLLLCTPLLGMGAMVQLTMGATLVPSPDKSNRGCFRAGETPANWAQLPFWGALLLDRGVRILLLARDDSTDVVVGSLVVELDLLRVLSRLLARDGVLGARGLLLFVSGWAADAGLEALRELFLEEEGEVEEADSCTEADDSVSTCFCLFVAVLRLADFGVAGCFLAADDLRLLVDLPPAIHLC